MHFKHVVPFSVEKILSNKGLSSQVNYPHAFSIVTLHSISTQLSLGKLSQHYGDADHYTSLLLFY